MASRKRSFGQLSKAARERAARAGRDYGLSRRQTRERYNRGTFTPFARDPERRVPVQFRHFASAGSADVDWQEAALDNMRATLSDYFKYNDDAVVFYTSHMSDDVARLVATASEDEILGWASVQPDAEGNFPDDPESWPGVPAGFDVSQFIVRVNDEYHNIFWYH